MNFIEELRKAGLVKSKTIESYLTKEDEQELDKMNAKDQQEVGTGAAGSGGTTTANVPTTVQPFTFGKEHQKGLAECIGQLVSQYENITGQKLHELYCPKCKPFDVSPATPDKGVPFGPKNPEGDKDQAVLAKDYGSQPPAYTV